MSSIDYCNNCGTKDHTLKECMYPKTSYGIICYKKIDDKYKFLLICRRNSQSYTEFLRGRYKLHDTYMLHDLFKHMTINERNIILSSNFDKLWDDMWINNKYKKTDSKSDYEFGRDKYDTLKKGIIINYKGNLINLDYIARTTYSIYKEPEWNFPKGRRNTSETDIECAIREFCEETNLNLEDIKIIDNKQSFVEIHKGTNRIKYRTIFFLAEYVGDDNKLIIDKDNKHQVSEISKIGWFDYEEILIKFREYESFKKEIIENVMKKLKKNELNLIIDE